MHSIENDKAKKTLIATLSGNIDINQGNQMLADIKNAVLGLNTKEYVLIINPENVSANIFLLPILQSFISLISEIGFKKIYLINADKISAFIRYQLANTNLSELVCFSSNVTEAINNL